MLIGRKIKITTQVKGEKVSTGHFGTDFYKTVDKHYVGTLIDKISKATRREQEMTNGGNGIRNSYVWIPVDFYYLLTEDKGLVTIECSKITNIEIIKD